MHYIKPVVQIFAETSFGDFFFKVAVCSGYNTNISLNGFFAADALKTLVLKNAQNLNLNILVNFANLVEEN